MPDDYVFSEGPADLDDGDEPEQAVRVSQLFSAPDRALVVYHLMYGKQQTLLPADDVIGAVRQLREQTGDDLQVMGSPNLASQLIHNDLVDEYRLSIEPIVLGGGKRLFPDDGRARKLELVSTTTSTTGVQMCTYRPVTD